MKTQSFEKVNSEKVLSTISLSEWFLFFFLRSTNFENRDLSSKQTINCVERVFAHYRYIALDFYYRMYIYIVDICIYRSNKAYLNVEISSRNYKKQNSKHAMVNYYSTK